MFKSASLVSSFLGLLCAVGASADGGSKLTIPDILDASALKDGFDGRPKADPCQNFYEFACGNWADHTTIPSDKDAVFHQFTALTDQTDVVLNKILAAYAQGDFRTKASASKKLGDYYASCMNIGSTAQSSQSILKGWLARIDQVKDAKQLARLVADLQKFGVNAFFGFGSGQDFNDSTQVIGQAVQGGMGLPERDYYFKKDPKSLQIIDHYAEHIKNILKLNGANEALAATQAHFIVDFESNLAAKAFGLDDRNDPSKINHPIGRVGLKAAAPGFDWDEYFTARGLPDLQKINVTEPDFFANFSRMLTKWKLSDLQIYLRWQLTHRLANSVSETYLNESFGFWNGFLHGEKQMKPRWKVCTQAVEADLGYALAEAYVGGIDGAAIKKRVEQMILWIKQAFADDLHQLSTGDSGWLDKKTMEAAIEKLQLVGQKLGAPTVWRDYGTLTTDHRSYLSNDLNVAVYNTERDLAKIGKPVDKSEWYMMPWEVNAYYDPPNNEFVFPFGILQPPSFDLTANDGANLGAFGGGTIGHELTHGFDKDGSQFDGNGNVKEWWTAETRKKFEERSACYIAQADAYKIKVGDSELSVNGKNTITENVADQGGVKLGYLALLTAQQGRPLAKPWLGRFSENQQYWIAYAQSWCSKRTPESIRHQISSNEHPPEEFRVNGVVMNRPEFAKDFECKDGDRMSPTNRCSLW